MSNPSPQPAEVNTQENVADGQRQGESLEQKLAAIDLSGPQPATESQQPKGTKRSARDLLEALSRRRIEITRINLTLGGSEAKGGNAQVVIATLDSDGGTSLESGRQVAIKKFIFSDSVDEEKFLRIFANEMHILDGLDHPNIVKLVGFVEDAEKRIAWLVFPWEANGNVREFLLSGTWELPERVSLIQDVAIGVEYLHTRQPPIRHGDLKSLNILVNSNHRAVITDFGSARIQTEARGSQTSGGSPDRQEASTDSKPTSYEGCPEVTVSATNGQLTLTGPSWSFRWAAPEILNEEEPCLASDIWALGWIAWEIATDNYPFPEAKTNKSITLNVILGRLPKVYDDDQLSQIGELCYLMVRCWKAKPNERPSVMECRNALQFIPSAIPRIRSDGISQIRSAPLLVAMGKIYWAQGRYEGALKHLEEGLAIAQSAGDKVTVANAMHYAADSHFRMSNYDTAEKWCNESLVIYTSIGGGLGRANALFLLGDIHKLRTDPDKAKGYFDQALAIFKDLGSSLGRAYTLERLGRIHLERSRYAKAEEYFNQAFAIYTGLGNNRGQANSLQGLGEMHQVRRNYDKAEEFLDQALDICKSLGDSHGQAYTLYSLGQIHQAKSNDAKAEEVFNQALTLYISIGSSLDQANVLLGLGETYQTRSNDAKAEEFFSQALVIYTRLGRRLGRANALLGLGEVLLRQARYSEAKGFLHEAAEVSNQINYRWCQTRSKKVLAQIFEAEQSSIEPLNQRTSAIPSVWRRMRNMGHTG